MEQSSETSRLAFNWLLAAGIVALAFSAFLFWSDEYLSRSTAENDNARTISEIRRAQASFPARTVDERQLRAVPATEASH